MNRKLASLSLLGLIGLTILACGGGGGGGNSDPSRLRRYRALNAVYTPATSISVSVGTPLVSIASGLTSNTEASSLSAGITNTSLITVRAETPEVTVTENIAQTSNDRQIVTVFGPSSNPEIVIMPYMNQGASNARITFAQLDSAFPNTGAGAANWDIYLVPAGGAPGPSTLIISSVGYNLDLPTNMVKWKNQVAAGTYSLIGRQGATQRFNLPITVVAGREYFAVSTKNGSANVVRLIDGGTYF